MYSEVSDVELQRMSLWEISDANLDRQIGIHLHPNEARQRFTSLMSSSKKFVNESENGKVCMVTITPDQKRLNMKEFTTACKEVSEWKSISRVAYCFEQGGEVNGEYPNKHLHMLFVRGKRMEPSRVRDRIRAKMGHFTGNALNKHFIDFQFFDLNGYEAAMKYIQGEKDPAKMMKVTNDQNFRRDFGLQDIYYGPNRENC